MQPSWITRQLGVPDDRGAAKHNRLPAENVFYVTGKQASIALGHFFSLLLLFVDEPNPN